jgi:hypothetical protein
MTLSIQSQGCPPPGCGVVVQFRALGLGIEVWGVFPEQQ